MGERSGHIVHIDTFSSAENFLFDYAEESDYDILLLDIEMGEMDGVTMAKKLRKENDTVQIVFITGIRIIKKMAWRFLVARHKRLP